MKKIAVLLCILLTHTSVFAKDTAPVSSYSVEKNGIIIEDAYIMGRKSTATGSFMKITNTTDTDDALIGIKPDPDFANRLEIHTVEKHNGNATMKQVPKIIIPQNQTVELKHGGYHVMIMGLHAFVNPNKTYPITLQFKNAGDIMVIMPVKTISHMRTTRDKHNHGQTHHHKHRDTK